MEMERGANVHVNLPAQTFKSIVELIAQNQTSHLSKLFDTALPTRKETKTFPQAPNTDDDLVRRETMAKRSDFAQKLLDDLRLRKEQMAAAHNHSKTASIDAYAYSRQTYRGSGEAKQRAGNGRNRSKSVDIVPFGRDQSPARLDLSMALAFALENGRKLGNNSVLSVLHQIGKGSVERRRSIADSPFPTLSHLHIKEVSKGADKLNQILKGCSNLDGYSVQMGTELLKGALDLEESLRMLVNMQEASEYMISPHRKGRLTLLEDGDVKQKQLELPMFSFDKPSHAKRRLAAVTYASNSNSVSHTPRPSYDLDAKTIGVFRQKDHSSSSKSKIEKGRIPSVIVKLMGLDELPQNVDPKYSTHTEKNPPQQPSKQKATQAHKSHVEGDRNPPWKDLEVTNSIPSSAETPVKMKKHSISDITLSNRNTARQKDVTEKEGKHDTAKQRGTEKSETKHELQPMISQKQRRQEVVVTVQEKTENKASKRLTQKPRSHLGIKQPYMLRRSEPQEEKEQHRAKQRTQVRKQKGNQVVSKILSKPKHDAINLQHVNHMKPSKQDPRQRIDALPSKWFRDNRHHEDAREGSSNVSEEGSIGKNLGQNSSIKYLESEPDGTPPFVEEKRVHAPVERKTESTDAHRSETPSKVDEIIMTEGNGSLNNFTESLKHQSSAMQVIKERKQSLQEAEAEARIMKSRELDVSIQPQNTAPNLQIEYEKASTAVGDEGLTIKEPEIVTSSDSSQRRAPVAIKDQQGQARFSGGEEAISDEIASDAINRTEEGNDTSYPTKLKHDKISKRAIQEPFTERENNLKQILMKSQLFLDTAEALLKLNISFGILNSGGQDSLDEDSKLVLDCGYELMKRKGTRQELSVHPCAKICIASTKISSLDDLVKQLDKDFEVLKLYGRNGKKDCNAEDYVPKMVESDLHDRYPDMNCMWDCGWNETTHAFHEKDDVVRDVERRVFNGLIDEIVRDFFNI